MVDVTESLEQILDETIPDSVRSRFLEQLDSQRNPDHLNLLLRILGMLCTKRVYDINAYYVGQAARKLRNVDDPRALEALLANLNHQNDEVREQIVTALGEKKCAEASRALIIQFALENPTSCVRESIIRSLGKIGDQTAEEALIRLATTCGESEVKRQAMRALSRIEDLTSTCYRDVANKATKNCDVDRFLQIYKAAKRTRGNGVIELSVFSSRGISRNPVQAPPPKRTIT